MSIQPSSLAFNTGHYDGDSDLDILESYLVRIKKDLGLLVGFQTPLHRSLERYEPLREVGLNRVSFCFEVFDPAIFEGVCPGKAFKKDLLDAMRNYQSSSAAEYAACACPFS